jgi:hypothetical protein
MELSLYKALSSIKIEEPLVDAVIKAMDTHIDSGISKAVIPVLAKLDSLSAKVDAYAGIKSEKQIRNRWIIGTLLGAAGLTVTVVTATIGILKALGYL